MDRTHTRVVRTFGTGRIKLTDDAGAVQRLQVDFGPHAPDGTPFDLRDHVPLVGRFGFTSWAPADSDVFVANMGGNASIPVALGTNHQPSRLKGLLAPGDSAQYDVRGAYVWLTATGLVIDAAGLDVVVRNAVHVTVTATTSITMDAPDVYCTRDLHVARDVYDKNGTLDAVRQAHNGHTHTDPQGGSTGGPSLTA